MLQMALAFRPMRAGYTLPVQAKMLHGMSTGLQMMDLFQVESYFLMQKN